MKYSITIFREQCKGTGGCGICLHVCPKKVYEPSDELTSRGVYPPEPVRSGDCIGCLQCMIYCPDMVIVVEEADDGDTTEMDRTQTEGGTHG